MLVEGKKILDIGPQPGRRRRRRDRREGKIVMPGFIDTHHHQFETALRSFLADGLLFNDGQPHGVINYFQYILGTFARVYRPEDVYISELFGSLSQLDAGVTTSHDISQIHYTQQHSDAAIKGSADSGRRIVFGYFEGARPDLQGSPPGATYPAGCAAHQEAVLLLQRPAHDDDHGRRDLPPAPAQALRAHPGSSGASSASRSHRTSSAASAWARVRRHRERAASVKFRSDNLFIHMTGMSDWSWNAVRDAGAGVSLAVPIEMNMRHGTPPILKTLEKGIQPSLSVDVEVTLTADMFTQMRTTMALQRAFVNQMALDSGNPAGLPELLSPRATCCASPPWRARRT